MFGASNNPPASKIDQTEVPALQTAGARAHELPDGSSILTICRSGRPGQV